MGGAYDSHINRDLVAPANALDDAFLQEAQELRLQRQGQIADLVQKQRAFISRFDLAQGLLYRTGKSALLISKQLAFEQRIGNGRTVYCDKTFLRPGRSRMQGSRKHFFPSTTLTEKCDRRVRSRDFFNRPAHLQHPDVACNDASQRSFTFQSQLPILELQIV